MKKFLLFTAAAMTVTMLPAPAASTVRGAVTLVKAKKQTGSAR